ncbi:tRNA epoxyqueuosine(34) reductase QueG [Alkaliphilus crotonatoxidans]
MELKEEIKKYAKEIGIDLIGFTSAEPFEELRPILEKRKREGKLSGFEEKNLDLRIDPQKTMAEARSIIVIGQSYFIEDTRNKTISDTDPIYRGQLARTAWGRDYHLVLKEKLVQIAGFIQEQVAEFQYMAFVDNGPLVDRQVAYRAGLGWYGLNHTLINQEYGSWFFIGYMLNNLAFLPDEPLKNSRCLECKRCLYACPSGALEDAQGFDANKCLSCQLQRKEPIPLEKRPVFGNRLYGCDVCQQVCPHNAAARKARGKDFIPGQPEGQVDLIKLLTMSNREFKEQFQQNASAWRGKRVLQRNAIMALVNHRDSGAAPYLLPLLKDSRLEIRKEALWALVELDPELALVELEKMKKYEKNQELIEMIDDYLKKLKP